MAGPYGLERVVVSVRADSFGRDGLEEANTSR